MDEHTADHHDRASRDQHEHDGDDHPPAPASPRRQAPAGVDELGTLAGRRCCPATHGISFPGGGCVSRRLKCAARPMTRAEQRLLG